MQRWVANASHWRWPTSVVVAAALLGSPIVASAQAPGGDAGPDWRQQMVARGSSTVSVDQALANLTKNLGLTRDQVEKIRPILQEHHDRILTILKSAPKSMTRDEFTAQVHAISAQTHDQVNALLTPKQLELVKQLGTPARI